MPPLSNNEIKKIRSLAEKKYRDELGLFVVEGEKMTAEAIHSGFGIEAVYHTSEIGEAVMKKISALNAPSPSLAVVRKPADIVLGDSLSGTLDKGGLFLALDSIRDPGNLGTILRIADWFGIDAVFASSDTVDVFNPKVVQATMGAIFRVKFHYADITEVCRKSVSCGGKAYGTFLDGENIYASELADSSAKPVVIVVGNESNGISAAVAAEVNARLRIPSFPEGATGSESLNAAVSTAVTVAEFRRRQNI